MCCWAMMRNLPSVSGSISVNVNGQMSPLVGANPVLPLSIVNHKLLKSTKKNSVIFNCPNF